MEKEVGGGIGGGMNENPTDRCKGIEARFFMSIDRSLARIYPDHTERARHSSMVLARLKNKFSLNKGMLNTHTRGSYLHRYFKHREHGPYLSPLFAGIPALLQDPFPGYGPVTRVNRPVRARRKYLW